MWCRFLVPFFILTSCTCNKEKIAYYQQLIIENRIKALTSTLNQDSTSYKPTSSEHISDYGKFDYIIIGAGSAGGVIANRLTEIPDNKVLLLEAGGSETDYTDIPSETYFLQGLKFNWNYYTKKQTTSCLGMVNHQCSYPRGKGLGGSSIINALMYVRGNRIDYDNWCGTNKDCGWSYKDVLPLFKKSEKFHAHGDDEYRGKSGNLHISYPQIKVPQFDTFVNANIELGRKYVDYNGKEQLGVGKIQLSAENGKRCSVGKSFLKEAIERPNLTVSKHSLAIKLVLNKNNNKCTGVVFSHNGKLHLAKVRKEVIVSGGVVGSAQLLMLSGIGPKEHLEEIDIPLKINLPVGDNFQDHATYFGLHFTSSYQEPTLQISEYIHQYLNHIGTMTTATNVQGVAFLQTKFEKITGRPDIEYIFISSNNTVDIVPKAFHYTEESYKAIWGKIDPTNSFTIVIMLLHPKSRGSIKLKSNSPYDYPIIDTNFLSDENNADIETMYEGIKHAIELLDTTAFKNLNVTLSNSTHPDCQMHEYLSKNYWYCHLRQLTTNIYHGTGTCSMGSPNLSTTVVDYELKVLGVENLRVADASIIPEPTSGHTNAPAIMIGEKVSELIKNQNY